MNIIKPGQTVWIIKNDCVRCEVAKDVCTGAGEVYVPEDGDDCHVRFNRRCGDWYKHDRVYLTERDAKLTLAAKFRAYAANSLEHAEQLEREVANA